MRQAEEMASQLSRQGDFSFEAAEQLAVLMPEGSQPGRRGSVKMKKAGYFVFGGYARGGHQGVTRRTTEFPKCTQYWNKFLRRHVGPSEHWTSIAISINNHMKIHRDVNNMAGYKNLLLGFGNYTGGGLWVAGQQGEAIRITGNGEKTKGCVLETKRRVVKFSPKDWHGTEPWTGTRIVLAAYVSRATHMYNAEEREVLVRLGFRPPPRPTNMACVSQTPKRDDTTGREEEHIKRQLYKLHAATGHGSTKHLVSALKRRGAKPEVIRMAEQFRCSICEERQKLQPRHVASLEPLPPKFHTVSADVGHWFHAGKGEHVQFMCVIDEGSRFRVAKILSRGKKQQPTGAACVQYLDEGWSQIFGQPRTLRLDPAGNFRSKAVELHCERNGVFLDLVPGEAHWKIGVCEQAVQGLKEVMDKLVADDESIEPEEALSTAVRTFNQRDLVRGFSPTQHVLGQAPDESGRIDVSTPAVPPELLVENPSGEFQRAVRQRQEAEKALAEWIAQRRLVKAANSRSRKNLQYQPGDLVYYWRVQEAKNKKLPGAKRGRFVGPARVLAVERRPCGPAETTQSSIVWLVRGRLLVKACVEQLRPASEREELLEAVSEAKPTPWTFTKMAEQLGGNQYEDVSGMQPEETEWRRAQDVDEEMPPVRQHDRHGGEGDQRRRLPKREHPREDSEDEELIPDEHQRSPNTTSRRRTQKGPPEIMFQEKGARWQDHISETAWYIGEQAYWQDQQAGVEIEVDMPDNARGWKQAVNNMEAYMVNNLKRRAIEVSEKHMTPQERQAFAGAKAVEVKNFIAAQAFEALPDHLKPSRQQAIGMRWCLTWKLKEDGTSKAKARAVLLGYQDPSYEHRPTTAPVMTRQSRQMIIQQASNRSWTLYKGDVSGAFLQGKEYEELLHCVPCDEICDAMGVPRGSITRLRKACYGLVDAPLQWFRSVADFFASLGLTQTWSDACTWVWRVEGHLRGMISSHVDDFIFGGRDDDAGWQEILQKIQAKFRWGDWERNDFVQCGVRIRKQGPNFVLSQEQYIDNLKEIPLSATRKRERKEATTEREKTSLRALLGGVSWLAQQTAPHASAEVGLLLSEVGKSTVETIVKANILLSHVRAKRDHQMIIHAFEPGQDLTMYGWVDAGSQNRVDGGSTQGIFIGLGPTQMQEGALGAVSPMAWHSSRIDRTCRSPGTAEAQAAVNGEDALFFARYQWSELEYGNVDPRDAVSSVNKITGCLVTDSRNVFDKLKTEVIVIKGAEKRTSIELLGLKESQLSTGLRVRWVHSEAQLANGLTKMGRSSELELYYQMGHFWKIVEDPYMRSARRRKAEGMQPLEGTELRVKDKNQEEEGGGADASETTCAAPN